MKNMVSEDFESCSQALNYIDELKIKNSSCDGKLSNTSKQVTTVDATTGKNINEFIYTWHVTYDANLVENASKA